MIFVFKTSVKTRSQVKKLKPQMDNMLPIAKWNFDLDDCDNILRIDCKENIVSKIINLLKAHEFNCEELP